jgi:endonuclease YncB( thermonuclease family)
VLCVVIAAGLFHAAFASSAPAGAGESGCKLVRGDTVTVASAIDGETVTLDDGRVLKLAGIQAPRLAGGRARAWPLGREAHDALSALVAGQTFKLKYDRMRSDRHGRIVAFLFPATGPSIQARMVEAGFARVAPTRDVRGCMDALLIAEGRARAVQRGLWADPFYAVRDAADTASLERLEGSYQIVEGRITGASSIRGRLYINFGDDWRQDFTVTVAPADVKLFRAGRWAGILTDISALEGRRIRVRGAIGRFNGPDISVTVPEQIEFLGEGEEAADGGGERTGPANKRTK